MVFHLPPGVLSDPKAMALYYGQLIDGLRARGVAVQTVLHARALVLDQVAADEGFHICDHGAHRHPRILNTGVAYIYPFRNLDPWGIRAQSSIAAKRFDPASVDPGTARVFTEGLRRRLIGQRRSRYDQPTDILEIPKGCVAVFLQSEAHRSVEETCYLTMRQMVGALLARPDPRPIVIKPHPRDFTEQTHRFLRRTAKSDPRVTITLANIHDVLAAADVVVTINSAVGIEAMVHRRPVVLCGHADFHHGAQTVRSAADLDAGIARTEAKVWPHDAFLYWYFGLNCLAAGKDSLVDDFLAKVAETGFDPTRLGL